MVEPIPVKRPRGRPPKKKVAVTDDATSFSTAKELNTAFKHKPRRAADHVTQSVTESASGSNVYESEESAEKPQRKDQKPAARSAPAAAEKNKRKRHLSQEAQQQPRSKQHAPSNEVRGYGPPPTKIQREPTPFVFRHDSVELLNPEDCDAQHPIEKYRHQDEGEDYKDHDAQHPTEKHGFQEDYSFTQPPRRAVRKAPAKQPQLPTRTDGDAPLDPCSSSQAASQEPTQKVTVGVKMPRPETAPSEKTSDDQMTSYERTMLQEMGHKPMQTVPVGVKMPRPETAPSEKTSDDQMTPYERHMVHEIKLMNRSVETIAKGVQLISERLDLPDQFPFPLGSPSLGPRDRASLGPKISYGASRDR